MKIKKKLSQARKLMENHHILAIYAEQVVKGEMTLEEAIKKSFSQHQNIQSPNKNP